MTLPYEVVKRGPTPIGQGPKCPICGGPMGYIGIDRWRCIPCWSEAHERGRKVAEKAAQALGPHFHELWNRDTTASAPTLPSEQSPNPTAGETGAGGQAIRDSTELEAAIVERDNSPACGQKRGKG